MKRNYRHITREEKYYFGGEKEKNFGPNKISV
jgi:hypothetical protein